MKVKVLVLIFFLALFLRTYKLGTFPFGFHVDEVKVGWNALSILKTGKDDSGAKLALYYNSFGDFRPTGIFYATIPSIILFGRNEFAVRFPSALLGALTVFPLAYFVYEILKKAKEKQDTNLPLYYLAPILLAVSPWHIAVSRATSEVIISAFFGISGLFFLLRGINDKKISGFILSAISFSIGYFFYHSIRLLAPLFVLTVIVFLWRELKDKTVKKAALAVLGILILFTFILTLNPKARGRFSQVSIFKDLDVSYELSRMPFEEGPNKVFIARMFHNKPIAYTKRFINEYAKYLSADFFLNSQTAKPARYQTVGVGILSYIELFLFLAGIVATIRGKGSALVLLLLLASPTVSALTTEDSPNLHRSLFMIIFIPIIAAYGFSYLLNLFPKYKSQVKYILTSLIILNFIYFAHLYLIHNKVHNPLYRNVGAKELAEKINSLKDQYEKIILTNIPDDPYPWIAFFTNQDPKIFNADAIKRDKGVWESKNMQFTGLRCPSRDAFEKIEVKSLLVVDAEGCAKESKLNQRTDVTLLETIKRPDETEVYTLWSYK